MSQVLTYSPDENALGARLEPLVHRLWMKSVEAGIDANATTAGTALDISQFRHISLSIENKTGAHTAHILRLEYSNDQAVWEAGSAFTVGDEGTVEDDINAQYARFRVSTVQGAASVVDTVVFCKR